MKRIEEINRAKKILSQNRNLLDKEVKIEMIKFIRHKMSIIESIEQELEIEGTEITSGCSSPHQKAVINYMSDVKF